LLVYSGLVVNTCQVVGSNDSSDETSNESRLSLQRLCWDVLHFLCYDCCFSYP